MDRNGIMLSEAIAKMQRAIDAYDVSDEVLSEDKTNATRMDLFAIPLWSISVVPASFTIQLAKKLLETQGDQFINFEE